jgi:hypothetical protein
MDEYLRRQRLEFAKFDAFINSFTPYLKNVNKSVPIQQDIIRNGDCFFHSLEYAIGNVGLYRESNTHVSKTRLEIVNSLISRVGRDYMVARFPLYKYRRSKKWAEDIITREAAIYANKCLFIISYNPPDETKNVKSDENHGRVTLIQPIGLELNAKNIIFIVNKYNFHFVTFKTRSLGVNQKLITPVIGTEPFIKGLNDFLRYNPNADISTIEDETKKIHNINLFSFLLKDLMPYLNRNELSNAPVSNHQEINNRPVSNLNLESTLAPYISNDAIEPQLAQFINNESIQLQNKYNAKKESNAKKVLSLKERRANEKKQRNAKRMTQKNSPNQFSKNNTTSNRVIAELLAKEEQNLANEQFARSFGK